MSGVKIDYQPIGFDAGRVSLSLPSGMRLVMEGNFETGEPTVEGSERFTSNRMLTTELWHYALDEHASRRTRQQQKGKHAKKRAKASRARTRKLATLLDRAEPIALPKEGWCSNCWTHGQHMSLTIPITRSSTYLCTTCGAPTTTCSAPLCDRMAVRPARRGPTVAFCAEHRHQITSFDDVKKRVADLSQAGELLKYRVRNFRRIAKTSAVAGGAAAAFVPLSYAFAPLLGGIVGAQVSAASGAALYGAAATNYGLALLGFGPIATGGLGMTGGIALITTIGGIVGGATGGLVARAYVSEDSSFKIWKVADGDGDPILLANGFLTERKKDWKEWEALVRDRFPNSPIYLLRWGSKDLRSISETVGSGSLKFAAQQALKNAGRSVSKSLAKSLGPAALAATASDLAANPWHVAKSRADKTATILADVLSRTEEDGFILIGHSLGGRIMARTAMLLGASEQPSPIKQVHLLGPAISEDMDWHLLDAGVTESATCYYSPTDTVLNKLYRVAQGGQKALGSAGFPNGHPKLHNSKVTVSKGTKGHSEYIEKVRLRKA